MQTIWNRVKFTKVSAHGISAEVVHCCPETYRGNPSDIVVAAARVSFGSKEYEDEQRNTRLLKRLYDDNHTSPFEMASMTFKIRVPKFVMVQLLRHRTFKFNELSQRYRFLKDEYFTPLQDPDVFIRYKHPTNKQGSCTSETHDDSTIETFKQIDVHLDEIYKAYSKLVKEGNVAKEVARYCLPMGMWTEAVVQMDLNNMMKFLRLRRADDAQYEIGILATEIEMLLLEFFPRINEIYHMDKPAHEFANDFFECS